MERQVRGIPIWGGRNPSDRLHRLGLIAALTLSTLLMAGPVQACVSPAIIDMWVIIRGDDIWIIIRGYQTFPPSLGTVNCACGLQRVSSIASLNSGHIRDTATGEIMPGFGEFNSNPNTAASLASAAGGSWYGVVSPVIGIIPPGRPIFIELHGKIRPGFTLTQVIDQLRSTRVATAEAEADGDIILNDHFHLEQPAVVDPAPGAPAIRLTHMEAGPPQSLDFMVRDTEDGLQRLEVMRAVNAEATIAPFTPGTRAPVTMTIVKVDGQLPASFTVRACNVLRECSTQTSTFVAMENANRQNASQHTFRGIRAAQHKVLFLNGDPGVRMLSVIVNGRRLSLRPLASGQMLEADISLALQPENNTVQVSTRGAPGSWGMLLLSDR